MAEEKKLEKPIPPRPQAPVQPAAPRPQAPAQSKDYRHLVRVCATDLDGRKHVMHALTKIRGIKIMYANAVCGAAGIDKRKKTGELIEAEVQALEKVIGNPQNFSIPVWMYNRRKDPETGDDRHMITADLTFAQDMDIKLMKKTKSYKGLRHQWGLPVRGQRTKSNFRKNKGKSLGVIRKKTAPPAGKRE